MLCLWCCLQRWCCLLLSPNPRIAASLLTIMATFFGYSLLLYSPLLYLKLHFPSSIFCPLISLSSALLCSPLFSSALFYSLLCCSQVSEQLAVYQSTLKGKSKQLKAMASELNMYQGSGTSSSLPPLTLPTLTLTLPSSLITSPLLRLPLQYPFSHALCHHFYCQ